MSAFRLKNRWKSDRISFSLTKVCQREDPPLSVCEPHGGWAQIKGCQGDGCEYFNRASKSTGDPSPGRGGRALSNLQRGDGPPSPGCHCHSLPLSWSISKTLFSSYFRCLEDCEHILNFVLLWIVYNLAQIEKFIHLFWKTRQVLEVWPEQVSRKVKWR